MFRLALLGGIGLLLGSAVPASAIPVMPAGASVARDAAPTVDVVRAHHKPGHVGGRGRHLGWYKKNRGKHRGWRR